MLILKRLIFILLLLVNLSFGIAQEVNRVSDLNSTVQFDVSTATLEYYLNFIQDNSSFVLSYTNKINLTQQVRLQSSEITISEFLRHITDSCSLNYTIANKKIVLEPKRKKYFVLYGRISAQESNEWLIGATAVILSNMNFAYTNSYGFYSIKVEGGVPIDIGFNSQGYNSAIKRVTLYSDSVVNIKLKAYTLLEEVMVFSNSLTSTSKSQMSAITINANQINSLPTFVGEPDIIKSLEMLPGIQSGNEGFGGFYVRGGGVEQNLFLLDDVPLYGTTHLLGMFSVFNTDAINQVTILKGGFPAHYGGRVSSVVDIKLKEGNDNHLRGLASVGLSSARLSFDGPAVKSKSTFSISARRTFHDIASFTIPMISDTEWNFFYYDINAKYNHIYSPRSRLYVSFFKSYDKFSNSYNKQDITVDSGEQNLSYSLFDSNNIAWGNLLGSVRWNYLLKSNLFVNSQLSFTQYKYNYTNEQYEEQNEAVNLYQRSYKNGVQDIIGKVDFDYAPTTKHAVKFGINNTYHLFQPGVQIQKSVLETDLAVDTLFGGDVLRGNELHLYVEDDVVLLPTLKANIGLRLVSYFAPSVSYLLPEPRVSVRYLINSTVAIKTAYSRSSQFIHLVSSSLISLPTDLWFPVTSTIKPLTSNLVTLGVEWDLFKVGSFSMEAYYKNLNNVLDVKDGSSIYGFSYSLLDQLAAGQGWSQGVELLYQVKTDRWMGWIGYTLSKTTLQFAEVNKGVSFPARYDRRHDASISLTYKLRKGVDLGATWQFATGNGVTLPNQQYYSPSLPTQPSETVSQAYELIGERNGFTTPNFHRLDISTTFTSKRKWGESIWNIGVYNVYGRDNPTFVYVKKDDAPSDPNTTIMQLSIFPIPIPYFRYTAKF